MDRVDCVVVGAGVVGLAIGRALTLAGRDVLVVEAARSIGTGTSSRNSEVVHAGIYYTPGSLKARLCVDGRRQLYAYCAERGVAHRKLGKFIVGTQPAHEAKLAGILAHARGNGVENIDWIEPKQALAAEPALRCLAALHSRETGIVDSHGLMLALQGDIENAGGLIAFDAPLERATRDASGWTIATGGTEPFTLGCDWLVNAAGLQAQQVAAAIEPLPVQHVPRRVLARGCYFSLPGRAPFSRLIYPVPVDGGLGVHLTLDLGGQAKFGPDVEWIDSIDYTVDPQRADLFYAEIREYWPALPDGALQPAYAGIRPKLSGPGEPARDFVIDGPAEHGVDGLVNLFGIESPGLTASLAIGAAVATMVTRA
ncbi:MAG: NAD(P)/FAD-dependent oxidoreductase [Burkholderiaceae bacterium]|jgi:L-2-hydroxyglutarate oxidase LhgO|nr:NAD(P)/FAD-dependent oxidoreductase [Burkholderiaceae bacterium]